MYARADKPSNTAERLRLLMEERNLRQVDIIALTEPYASEMGIKVSKSDLSQWLSGRSEPKQDKLLLLAKALRVNPGWLMGIDVSREWVPAKERAKEDERLKDAFHRLTKKEREQIMWLVERLAFGDGEA